MKLTLPYPVSANRAGIYRITDAKTGRFYVGSSVNVAARWRQHQYRLAKGTHPNPMLQAVHNADATRLSIALVEEVAPTREALLAAEQDALDAAGVGTNRLCMNVLAVAGSHLGRKRSEATRAALAAAQRGKKASPETKAKMRAAKVGKKQSREHVAKVLPHLQAGNARRWVRDRGKPSEQRVLTTAQAADFLRLRADGWTLHQLRRHFAIGFGTAQRLGARETYKDIVE